MANIMKSFLLLCATFSVVVAKHEVYEGHSLYEVNVKDADQATYVNALENQIPIDTFMYANVDRAGQILVPKDLKAQFESTLASHNIDYKIQVENIRELLEQEDQMLAAAAARSNSSSRTIQGLNFDEIHDLDVVYDYLDRLAAQFPNIVTVASAGSSIEGRDLKYLKISSSNFQDQTKPVVFLQSLLHAREWVSLPATLYAIEKLVFDVQERNLLETIDWIILPIANPDGYAFSHSENRFWRKNRARGFIINDFCMGVDLNRNFDVNWGTASSNIVCMDTFHGRGPTSEPETQGIVRIIEEHRSRMAMYIDFHSFGSMILYGFGNGQFPPNVLTINVGAVNMAQAIDRVKWASKPNYIVGNIFHVLYAASGGSSDYAQVVGVPLSYTYELPAWRGVTGTVQGFLVDPDFIEQVGFETWEGIKAGATFARDLFV